jgi:predicted enzyme related to lactoylglutathione lyase
MIHGAHALIYARDPEKARAFFRDVLRFPAVDAGHGWLIFALPPAELGIHPTEGDAVHQLYLMCDDIQATMAELSARGVRFTRPVEEASFGRVTALEVPGAGEIGLYQPKHPTALRLGR